MTPQHPYPNDTDPDLRHDDTLDLDDDLDLDGPSGSSLGGSGLGGSLGGTLHAGHHDPDMDDLDGLHDGGRQSLTGHHVPATLTQTPLPVSVAPAAHDDLDLDSDLNLDGDHGLPLAPAQPTPVRASGSLFKFSEPETAPVPVTLPDTAVVHLRPVTASAATSVPVPSFDEPEEPLDLSEPEEPLDLNGPAVPVGRASRLPKIGRVNLTRSRVPRPARTPIVEGEPRAPRAPMNPGRKLLVLGAVLLGTAALATAAVMALNPPASTPDTTVSLPGTVQSGGAQPGTAQTTSGGDLGLPSQPSMVPSAATPPVAAGAASAPVFIPGGPNPGQAGAQKPPARSSGTVPAKGNISATTGAPLPAKSAGAARPPTSPHASTAPKPGVKAAGTAPVAQPAMRDPFAAQAGLGDLPATAQTAAPTQAAAPVTMRPPTPASTYQAPAPLPMPRVLSVPAPVQVAQAPAPVVPAPLPTPLPTPLPAPVTRMPAAPAAVRVTPPPSAPAMNAVPLPQYPSPVGMPQAVLIPAPKPVHVNQAQSAVRRIGLSLSGTHKVGDADVGLLTTSAGGYQEVTAGDTLPELNATVTAVTASSLILKVGKDSIKLTLGEPQK